MAVTLLPQYFVKLGGKTQGPVPVNALRKLAGFTLQTPVQLQGSETWSPAFQAIDLKAYFHNPVRDSFQSHQSLSRVTDLLTNSIGILKIRRRPLFSKLSKMALLSTLLAVGSSTAAWKIVGVQEIGQQLYRYSQISVPYVKNPQQTFHQLQRRLQTSTVTRRIGLVSSGLIRPHSPVAEFFKSLAEWSRRAHSSIG
jgi:hypothetical protein